MVRNVLKLKNSKTGLKNFFLKIKMNYRFLILLLVAFLHSCQRDQEPDTIYNLEEDLQLYISQDVNETGPYLLLGIETVEPVNCTNIEFSMRVEKSQYSIRMFLDDVLVKGACMVGAAHVTHEEEIVYPEETTYVKLNLLSTSEKSGFIGFSGSNYYLSFQEGQGLVIDDRPLKRLPEQTAWGYFNHTSQSGEVGLKKAEQFLDGLKVSGNIENGYYGLVEQTDDGFEFRNDTFNIQPLSFFVKYQDEAVFMQQIQSLLQQYPALSCNIKTVSGNTLIK